MVLSSGLQSRSEGSFGRAAAFPLRKGHNGGGHTRSMCALMAAGEHRPGRCVWMGRSATREGAAMAFAEATGPSEITRKTMSRKKSSLWTSPEKLGRDRAEYDHVGSQQKSRREWTALSILPFVCIRYRGVWGQRTDTHHRTLWNGKKGIR